ncbi:MAG: hypothetical protein COA70_04560 [Planctomycetota bacterium]|nr:MAG: hypothetical protein COA70_04560 [Planctomycetota bacterium]
MNHDSFEQLVQECLDTRQDPLDHTAILAYVEAHPEALDALVDLRAVGMHTDWPPTVKRGKMLPWKWVSLVAAAALLVTVVMQQPDPLESNDQGNLTSSTLLVKAPVAKFLSVKITRSTSNSTSEVLHHKSSRSARILSVHTQTTQNILN